MKFYLRLLSVCYVIGAALHIADVFSARLDFESMTPGWKLWIVYLLVFDIIASIGLWRLKAWGVATFVLIAVSQLVAYVGFVSFFGDQTFLIVFHIVTLGIYGLLRLAQSRRIIF